MRKAKTALWIQAIDKEIDIELAYFLYHLKVVKRETLHAYTTASSDARWENINKRREKRWRKHCREERRTYDTSPRKIIPTKTRNFR